MSDERKESKEENQNIAVATTFLNLFNSFCDSIDTRDLSIVQEFSNLLKMLNTDARPDAITTSWEAFRKALLANDSGVEVIKKSLTEERLKQFQNLLAQLVGERSVQVVLAIRDAKNSSDLDSESPASKLKAQFSRAITLLEERNKSQIMGNALRSVHLSPHEDGLTLPQAENLLINMMGGREGLEEVAMQLEKKIAAAVVEKWDKGEKLPGYNEIALKRLDTQQDQFSYLFRCMLKYKDNAFKRIIEIMQQKITEGKLSLAEGIVALRESMYSEDEKRFDANSIEEMRLYDPLEYIRHKYKKTSVDGVLHRAVICLCDKCTNINSEGIIEAYEAATIGDSSVERDAFTSAAIARATNFQQQQEELRKKQEAEAKERALKEEALKSSEQKLKERQLEVNKGASFYDLQVVGVVEGRKDVPVQAVFLAAAQQLKSQSDESKISPDIFAQVPCLQGQSNLSAIDLAKILQTAAFAMEPLKGKRTPLSNADYEVALSRATGLNVVVISGSQKMANSTLLVPIERMVKRPTEAKFAKPNFNKILMLADLGGGHYGVLKKGRFDPKRKLTPIIEGLQVMPDRIRRCQVVDDAVAPYIPESTSDQKVAAKRI